MQVPSQFLTMLPYVATIVVLVLISRNANLIKRQHAGVARQAVLPWILTGVGLTHNCLLSLLHSHLNLETT